MRKRVTKKLSLGKLTVSNLSKIQGGVARGTEADLDSKAASCFFTCNDTCQTCDPACFTAILPICIPLTISECRTVCGGMVCL